METYFYEGDKKKPYIHFDKEKEIFDIKGTARSEYFSEEFAPAKNWVEEYTLNPNPQTIVSFKLFFCNTASSKQMFEVVKAFKKCQENGSELMIKWEYEVDDEDMLFLGKSIQELTKVPFEFISILEF